MTMYDIINMNRQPGRKFSAMCVFRSAIANAIYVARGEQMPKQEFTWAQRNCRFGNYVGDLQIMQNMWNALSPEDRLDIEEMRKIERLLDKIWWKYNR